MSNGFERRKEQSKEDIRRAAGELFGQFGVERVSVADIAAKAGVSQATIYNNFGSKDVLVREVVQNAVDGLVGGFEQVLAAEAAFPEKMAAFFAFIAELMARGGPSEAGAAIFTSSADLQNDPEIRKLREVSREKMTALLLGLVAEGRGQGAVNPNLSDEALAAYFRAFMDVFVDPRLQRRFSSSTQLVQELGSLMVHGLAGPGR